MTDDRAEFEAALLVPPHVARMLEHAGRFVERLDKTDKEKLLEDAMDRMFAQREKIKEGKDVLVIWIESLRYAATRRPYWVEWFNVYETRKVRGSQLGRKS